MKKMMLAYLTLSLLSLLARPMNSLAQEGERNDQNSQNQISREDRNRCWNDYMKEAEKNNWGYDSYDVCGPNDGYYQSQRAVDCEKLNGISASELMAHAQNNQERALAANAIATCAQYKQPTK